MFKKYPDISHILIVGMPGSYKDVTAVKFCHDGFFEENKDVFSNLTLDLPFHRINTFYDYDRVRSDNWNPGICYIHDIGTLFHSREFKSVGGGKGDARKDMVNNFRKRGVQIIGTCHRENEIDIELRLIMQWFIYPEVVNVGDKDNMEDDIVVLRWYDNPDMYPDEKCKFKTFYDHPERYAVLYDTLEENKVYK